MVPTSNPNRTNTKSSLSPERQQLLELIQQLEFGRIEQLVIQNGQPVCPQQSQLIREFKFGAQRVERHHLRTQDFTLNTQQLDFLKLLDDVRDGVIDVVECQNGLPFRASMKPTKS